MPEGTTARIIVIDDDPLMLSVIGRILQNAAFEAITATSVGEGKAAIEAQNPDLVLSDIYLGEGDDGFGLISWMRESRPRVPVIAMSGGDLSEDPQFNRAISLGAAAVLEKPFRAAAIIETVRAVLKSKPS